MSNRLLDIVQLIQSTTGLGAEADRANAEAANSNQFNSTFLGEVKEQTSEAKKQTSALREISRNQSTTVGVD